jgi:hypothetical protein
MNELDRLASLQAFGRQLDELADRDARRRAPRSHGALARFATAVALVAAIAGGAYAVPATRAAVDDVYGAFSDWVSGDEGAAPGRAVAPGEDVPSWVAAEDGEKRVLAQAGGEKLIAIRQGDKLTLALAAFGESDSIEGWRKWFSGRRIRLVGPGGHFIPNGRHDRRPLFGLVSASVKRIRFNYADGGRPVSEDNLAGAFGIVIETDRRPSSLTGYDQAGGLVARLDFVADPHDLAPGRTLGDFRYCPARGCLPWRK